MGACLAICTMFTFAQNPPELSFKMSTKDGQTRFRMGESIPLELSFDSTVPGRYEIHNPDSINAIRFTPQPTDGVAHPFDDFPALLGGPVSSGSAVPRPIPLNGQPGILQRELNSWLAFRKAGRYRITANVDAVTAAGMGSNPKANSFIPLQSSVLEIEIVNDPEWSRAELQANVAIIEAHRIPVNAFGRGSVVNFDDQFAAQKLALLDTRDSMLAMVSIYSRNFNRSRTYIPLDRGIRRSPFRADAIAAMEKAIEDPGASISDDFLGTLSALLAVANSKPPDYAKSYEYVFRKLATAFPKKQGEARTVSLQALAGYQGTGGPPLESVNIIFNNMTDLPAPFQTSMLTDRWLFMNSPAASSYLPIWASSSGPVRDGALHRLLEVNPPEARALILSRIRNGDWGATPPDLLLRLTDGPLPELDAMLAEALERRQPAEMIIARYATNAIYPRVRASYESNQLSPCGDLLAYFFRVDPDYASAQLALARAANPKACPLRISPLLMSPGLEAAAIRDLDHTDPSIHDAALNLLRDAGSSNAKQALLDRLDGGTNVLGSLARGRGWVLTPVELDRMEKSCKVTLCNQYANSVILNSKVRPVQISIDDGRSFEGFNLSTVRGLTFAQLQEMIRQYPPGTAFAFAKGSPNSDWERQYYQQEIRKLLDMAGMTVISP